MGSITFRRVVAAALLIAITGSSSQAEDYQCRKAGGCKASITLNGVVKTVRFRRGDLLSNEDGWKIKTEDGWVKVNPGKTRVP